MGESDDILKELSQVCNMLTACIENLVRIQHQMLNNVLCDICQSHIADSVCNTCGANLCTTCEIEHSHTTLLET
jgi:hypothetical protein